MARALHTSVRSMDLFDTNWLVQAEVTLKVIIAGVLGGLVGFERQLANRPAGVRTHAVMAATAALFVGLADQLVAHFVADSQPIVLRVDPLRIMEAIVTGVAFLGAGTIFRHRDENVIEGLTTAAALLLVAAVGLAVALGQMLVACAATAIALVLLRIVGRMVK